ncbi:MAG: hypothetical protein J6U68_04180 [Clostridia bacterium]|nr:hypothetical protein [Clostridia bacterium]
MDGTKVPSNWAYGGICHGKGAFSIIYGDMDIKLENPIEKFVVYTDTVGQYTGLTDKNGKKIFEGDIISTDIARPYLIVEFRDGCFMFNCNDGGEDYYDIMLPILKEPQTQYEHGEVIGNIHDNPELLKGGEQK